MRTLLEARTGITTVRINSAYGYLTRLFVTNLSAEGYGFGVPNGKIY